MLDPNAKHGRRDTSRGSDGGTRTSSLLVGRRYDEPPCRTGQGGHREYREPLRYALPASPAITKQASAARGE